MTAPTADAVDPRDLAVRPPSFALFAEMIAVGAVVSVLSLPVVTFLPALAAGIGHLRRHASLRADPMGLLLREFRAGLRGVWGWSIALPVVLGLVLGNVALLTVVDLPGGGLVRGVSLVVAAVVVVVALRAASRFSLHPGTAWSVCMRDAARDARSDLRGSLLLLVAAGLCGTVVWMLPVLVVLVPGMLTLAVVAVERRAAATPAAR